MIIISDTSPISSLLAIDQIELLPRLYAKIIIPTAVKEELLRIESRRPRIELLLSEDWLEVKQFSNQKVFDKVYLVLDQGESEAITLGLELDADLILIDETKGRNVARSLGLQVTGLLGIIIEAKQKKLISSAKEIIDDLVAKAGFWVKQDLYDSVIKAAGE